MWCGVMWYGKGAELNVVFGGGIDRSTKLLVMRFLDSFSSERG